MLRTAVLICGAVALAVSVQLLPQGRGNSVARWAQSMTAGCEKASNTPPPNMELATFGGGCFWGLELKMQRVPGVHKTSVGYANGDTKAPTYEQVCGGRTGYTEAVQVTYDPKEASFRDLLVAYTQQTDLTTKNRQGGDRGTQYRSGVYYHNDEQKAEAEKFFAEVNAELADGTPPQGRKKGMEGKEVVAELEPIKDYYVAEGYHQQYLAKGGRFGMPQSAEKGATDTIRCYG